MSSKRNKQRAMQLLEQGIKLFEQDKFNETEKVWQHIKREANAEAYAKAQLSLGMLFFNQNRTDEAQAAWQNIKREDDVHAYTRAQLCLGILFTSQHKTDKAQTAWQNIKCEDSAYAKAQLCLGTLFFAQNKTTEAQTAWQNIKREDDAYAKAQLYLGILFFNQNKITEAQAAWQNIRRKDNEKDYANAQFNLCLLFIKEKQFDDAKQAWKEIADEQYLRSLYGFTYEIVKRIIDSTHLVDLSNIFQSIRTILRCLYVQQDNYQTERQFAHYTRPSTAHQVLTGQSAFRLNTIANVNDPTEGKTLDHYLGNPFPEQTSNAVFISCFTFNHDSLNQFRLYGKENGKEATGCSIVLDKAFFNQSEFAAIMALHSMQLFQNKTFVQTDKIFPANIKQDNTGINLLPLYRCIYIDEQSRYISLACRDEITFYRENQENAAEKWTAYQSRLKEKQKVVEQELDNIAEIITKLKDKPKSEWVEIVNYILLPLKYLVKHAAFQEEQECRMFYITDWGDENIQQDFDKKWLYVNYAEPPLAHLRKIYLSPGAMPYQHFFEKLIFERNQKESEKAKLCISCNPFRNA